MLHENTTQLVNYILSVTIEVFQTLLKFAYNHWKYYEQFPAFRFSKPRAVLSQGNRAMQHVFAYTQ